MMWRGIRHPEYILPYLHGKILNPPRWLISLYHWEGGWKRYFEKYRICTGPYKMALRGRSRPYYLRWKDKEVIEEFYSYDGYEDITLSDHTTVIDIGAHIGLFTIRAAEAGSTVYAFEPSPHSYECLLRNIELYEVSDRVVSQNTAVTSEIGTVEIALSDTESLYDSTEIAISGTKRIVPSTTLSEIASKNRFEGTTLLKMDCEGAEFEIIRSSNVEDFEDIDVIFLEYHAESGNPVEIEKELESMGYSVSIRPDPRPFLSEDLGFLLAEK